MKRTFWISAVVVTVLAISLADVIAQPGGGGQRGQRGQQGGGPGGPPGGQGGQGGQGGFAFGGGPGGGMMGGSIGMLLRNEEAAKMLDITAEQREALQKIAEDARQQFRPQGQPGQPGGQAPDLAAMRQRADEMQAKVAQVLKPAQQEKAKELVFQVANGLEARALDERMLDVLALTADQKAKIRVIADKRGEEMREAMQNANIREMSQEERTKFVADNEARGKKYNDEIKALLTTDQKAKAEKLTAEAAEVRTKLGIPQPGQRGQGQGQQRQGGPQGGQGYTPGANAWRPGQDTPNSGAPRQRSNFNRNTQNQ